MDRIFEYLEYRDYLRAHYEHRKRAHAWFSYRYIASKVGIDASYYVKVLQKQLHISDKSISPLVQFLKLRKREEEYFRTLVRFNKAKNHDQIKHWFEKLISLRDPVARTLDTKKYEFFNEWYYIACKELLNFYPFTGDCKDLAAQFMPPITERQARKAVGLLEKLDLVRRKKDGSYELTEPFVTTGDSWRSIAIRNFQKAIMQLGADALDRIDPRERDISTVTVSTSRRCFEAMRERLKEVRKELMEMARSEEEVDDVYQITFQLFPLTRTRKKGSR